MVTSAYRCKKVQNLGNQALRLEKAQECSVDNSAYSTNGTSVVHNCFIHVDETHLVDYSGVAAFVNQGVYTSHVVDSKNKTMIDMAKMLILWQACICMRQLHNPHWCIVYSM